MTAKPRWRRAAALLELGEDLMTVEIGKDIRVHRGAPPKPRGR